MKVGLEIRVHDDGPNLVIWYDGHYKYYRIDAPISDDLILAAAACTDETSLAFEYSLKGKTNAR